MEKRLQEMAVDLAFKSEQLAQSQAAELEKLMMEAEAALAIERALNQTAKAVNEKLITAVIAVGSQCRAVEAGVRLCASGD